jgi:hypothetical protein
MNYPAASGRGINPKKQKQYTPQAAGELTQKRLKRKPQARSASELRRSDNRKSTREEHRCEFL